MYFSNPVDVTRSFTLNSTQYSGSYSTLLATLLSQILAHWLLLNTVIMRYANGSSLTAIGVIFPALSVLLFTIRTSRSVQKHKFEIDDILIIPAAVSYHSCDSPRDNC